MASPTDDASPASPPPPPREIDLDAVALGRRRLSLDDAIALYHHAPLPELGRAADLAARRRHGDELRTYVIDRNVNYTNVCSARCTFCAFRRDEGDDDAYTLSRAQLHQKFQELVDIGGTQVLLQGGMHPDLPLSFYEELLADLRAAFPQVHLHAFSPPEFVEFVAVCDVEGFPTPGVAKSHELPEDVWIAKLETIMRRLMDAGLGSIPGGGGEIFAEPVRNRIGRGKATASQWLEVMSAAHRLGMSTSATMMFGHIEGVRDRFDHMARIRDRQDRAIAEGWPGRYLSFIAWPFQRENTPLGRAPEWDREAAQPFPGDLLADGVTDHPLAERAGKVVRMAGASEYLRMQALGRLFLDNVDHMGSSWVTMGPKIGQLGLMFGADDMGSVMMEENVVSAAGTTYCLDEALLCRLIRDAGFIPAQRGNGYEILKTHPGPSAPDLDVADWSTHRVGKLAQESGQPRGDTAVPHDEGLISLQIATDRTT